jgi:hypothetical protein
VSALPTIRRDPFGRPDINPGMARPNGAPYVNWCKACGWTGSVALWYGDQRDHDPGPPPSCPECRLPGVVTHDVTGAEPIEAHPGAQARAREARRS